MNLLTEPMVNAGYKIQNHFTANARLRKWQTYFESPPESTQPPSPSRNQDEINVDDFITNKTEALITALLSYSHTDLVKKTKPVTDAFQAYMTTPHITRLIYEAVREAGALDGMVSAKHRSMISKGTFPSNAVARCYTVAHAKLQNGATHSIKSAFARAAKMHGEVMKARKTAPTPVSVAPENLASTSVSAHKKSPAKKAEDCGFYDR